MKGFDSTTIKGLENEDLEGQSIRDYIETIKIIGDIDKHKCYNLILLEGFTYLEITNPSKFSRNGVNIISKDGHKTFYSFVKGKILYIVSDKFANKQEIHLQLTPKALSVYYDSVKEIVAPSETIRVLFYVRGIRSYKSYKCYVPKTTDEDVQILLNLGKNTQKSSYFLSNLFKI